MTPAIPAATLILLRDVPGAAPELPMVSRGAHLTFAASLRVFPGGRIDEDDRRLAAAIETAAAAIDIDDIAHRIAAIRETIEEIGLAPGVEGIADAGQLAAIRAGLHAGESLSLLVERHRLKLDPGAIEPFARWLPNHHLSRRFDTRFYVARAPEIGEASADGSESTHCLWASAEAHLGAGKMIFPTIRNLEWIAQVRDFDDAVRRARSHRTATVTPWVETRDGEEWLCIPDDLGYPVSAQRLTEVDLEASARRPSITRAPG